MELIKKYLIDAEQYAPTLERFLREYRIPIDTEMNEITKEGKHTLVSELLFKEDGLYNPAFTTCFEVYEIDGETFYMASSMETPDENKRNYYCVYTYFKLENDIVRNIYRQLDTSEILQHIPNDLHEFYLLNEAPNDRDTILEIACERQYAIEENILDYLYKSDVELINIFNEKFSKRVQLTVGEFAVMSFPDKIKTIINILWNNIDLPFQLFNLMF